MRHSLATITAWLLLVMSGCMSPINADHDGSDETDVVMPDPLRDAGSLPSGSSVAFSMDVDRFANLAAWLGHENTLTIEKAVHVERDNVTLDAKAGTRFSYTMGDDTGKFTFESPLPTVKANFASKIVGGVALRDVTINADGTGVAGTASFGKWPFRWLASEDNAGLAAAEALPEVWCYSMPACPPCNLAKKELDAATDLPFKPVWKQDSAPDWLTSRPAFWWHISGTQPSQSDVKNTRQSTGWNGLKDFQARWKNSREPKRFQREER